jgi:hypothetical protein
MVSRLCWFMNALILKGHSITYSVNHSAIASHAAGQQTSTRDPVRASDDGIEREWMLKVC